MYVLQTLNPVNTPGELHSSGEQITKENIASQDVLNESTLRDEITDKRIPSRK